MRMGLRYSLRTLVIAVTIAAVVCGYYVYRLSLQGRFYTGSNYSIRQRSDPRVLGQQLREQLDALPEHELSDEVLFEVPKNDVSSHENVSGHSIEDRFFFRVKLRDGTVTHVGFWVYALGPSTVGITYGIQAHDSYLTGPAGKRREERIRLSRTYSKILSEIQVDAEKLAAGTR